jgi:hypothetical protein
MGGVLGEGQRMKKSRVESSIVRLLEFIFSGFMHCL